jgi:hypothetical protein
MIVINHNTKTELPADHITFFEAVVREYDARLPEAAYNPGNISMLLDEIPVVIVDVPTQDDHSSGDLLGFYMHTGVLGNIQAPLIGLCLERIYEETKNIPETYRYLTTKVLIHEFAHAMMAATPQSVYRNRDNAYRWIEEPMANMVTLLYLSLGADESSVIRESLMRALAYSRWFMLNQQPDEYKMGVVLYDQGIRDWWTWRSMKGTISDSRELERKAWQTCLSDAARSIDQAVEKQQDILLHWWRLVGTERQLQTEIVLTRDTKSIYDLLFHAVSNGDADASSKILAENAVNVRIEDWKEQTLLHHAATGNSVEVAKMIFHVDPTAALELFPDNESIKNRASQELYQKRLQWLPNSVRRRNKSNATFGRF